MQLHENPGKSRKYQGNPGKSREIKENQGKSQKSPRDICGKCFVANFGQLKAVFLLILL
jgi:hypothetical protein